MQKRRALLFILGLTTFGITSLHVAPRIFSLNLSSELRIADPINYRRSDEAQPRPIAFENYTPARETAPATSPRTATTYTHPLTGAYKAMAVHYQSCDVLKLELYTPARDGSLSHIVREQRKSDGTILRSIPASQMNQAAQAHYYVKNSKRPYSDPQICQDIQRDVPTYQYAGRPSVSKLQNENEFDMFTRAAGDAGRPSRGQDCSAFVSAAYSAAGLKLRPTDSVVDAHVSTSHAFVQMGRNSRQDCFDRVDFNGAQTIESGDVMAWNGHMLMIDDVDDDPFGVKQAADANLLRSEKDCNYWAFDPKKLNFSVIQSGSTGDLGVTRMAANVYFSNSAVGYVKSLAKNACLAYFGRTVQANLNARNSVNLIRHTTQFKNRPKRPECVSKPPLQMTRESCIAGCFDRYMKGTL